LRRRGWIANDSDMGHLRRNFLQQLRPFGTDAVFEHSKAGSVATGPCQAGDQAIAYWVNDTHEHDRHSTGFPLQCSHNRGGGGQDDVRARVRPIPRRSYESGRWSATTRRLPSGNRSSRCDRRSSPVLEGPAGTRRCGIVLPDRPKRGSSEPRSGAGAPASGHPATPLPRNVMNSRRLMGLTARPRITD
jgi:hypothetical protein